VNRILLLSVLAAGVLSAAHPTTSPVLWRDPAHIQSRDLFYGSGGKARQPRGPFVFVKEDLKGTSPKFIVRDRDGVKWKIKLGVEARPETVATRLVWAVGYFAHEEYFLPELRVEDMPRRLHRGRNLVNRDGSIHNAVLRRSEPGWTGAGHWSWRHNPFSGTRQLGGLRVIMAVLNNWDLKDSNNGIFLGTEERFMVTDLGASFGANGRRWTRAKSKGNLKSYRRSRFLTKIAPRYVSFATPGSASPFFLFADPVEFVRRFRLRWIGRHIPREDARWAGRLLARLLPAQIRAAFQAAGYSPQDVDSFSGIVETRIAALNRL
jgi:hypothetical protein